jgi:hypothetical protein
MGLSKNAVVVGNARDRGLATTGYCTTFNLFGALVPAGQKRDLLSARLSKRCYLPHPGSTVVNAVKSYSPPRASGDSLDAYFRQIASAPLLTREGEITLARRIEEAELEVAYTLLDSRAAVSELVGIADDLAEDRVRPHDVTRNAAEDDPESEAAARAALLKPFAPIRALGLALARRRPGRSLSVARARRSQSQRSDSRAGFKVNSL